MWLQFLDILHAHRRFALNVMILVALFQVALPVGIIGEVEPMWGPIPQTSLDKPISCLGDLCLFSTRPLLRWHTLPIMLNVYTSAFPDWIHWVAYQITESILIIRCLQILCTAWAINLLLRCTESVLEPKMQWFFWLLLMTDWGFLFYKKALGNTEIMLQVAWMMCIIPLFQRWDFIKTRRWLMSGILLGTFAKITFVLQLIPLSVFILWSSNKRWQLLRATGAAVLVALIPMIGLGYWTEQVDIPIQSHDFWAMQWSRIEHALQGQSSNVREHSSNLWRWLFDPLQFFTTAYAVPDIIWHGWGRAVGYTLTLWMLIRAKSKPLWILTGILCLQVLVLSMIAQDMHHIVIATPLLWYTIVQIWQHDNGSQHWKTIAIIGFLCSHLWMLLDSPRIIQQVQTPTFSETRQQDLAGLLKRHHVTNVTTMDYEVFGVLEVISPELDVLHIWPSISTQRWKALPTCLEISTGGHLIVLESSMPMIYNLQPTTEQLEKKALQHGYRVELVEAIQGVRLYHVGPKQ